MSAPWIKVDLALLQAALADFAEREESLNDEVAQVPTALIQGIVEYLSDDLGCDHSVNICMCDTVGIVEELNLTLQGRRTCGTCHGDTYTWDQAKADAAAAVQSDYADDFAGMVTCPTCEGRGSVTA
jgi:hypothetical protein